MYVKPTDIKVISIDNHVKITEFFNDKYCKNKYFDQVNLNKKFKAKDLEFELQIEFM